MVFEQKELKILVLAFFTFLFIGITGIFINITGNPVLSIQEECADGTLMNECSPTKPLFCNPQLQLIERCDLCGCPIGSCQSNGYCKEEKTSLCIPSPEICDGKDNDCDGSVDGGVCSTNTVSSFQQVYGKEWKIETDKNNIPIKLSGGNVPTEQITGKREKIAKDNINIISKTFIDKNKDLLKVDSSNLKPTKIFSNPKSKVHVIRYEQKYQSVPVYNSYTTIAYSGDSLTFYKTNYDPSIQLNTIPKITKEKTLENIKRDLSVLGDVNGFYSTSSIYGASVLANDIAGINKIDSWIKENKNDGFKTNKLKSTSGNYINNLNPEKSELVIFPLNIIKGNGYRLAWKIDLPLNTEEGEKWTYFVDTETGGVIYKFDNIVYATVSGNVQGKIYPETPTDGFEIRPLNHEIVYFEDRSNETVNGTYSIDSTYSSGNLSSEFKGSFSEVDNYKQPKANFIQFVSSLPANVSINWESIDTSYKNEESNVFYHFNFVHDYFTRGGAFDIYDLNNIKMTATVEVPGSYCGVSYNYCNACAGGNVMYFFGAGELSGFGYCEATSLGSDIIYHEYTHNVHFAIYEGINMPYYGQTGGMMEGWADYFASTITNDPVMGENIFPEPIRYLNNSLRYPEDYNPEPHAASEVFSPALWEIRQAIGAELADVLVLNAMKLTPMSFSEFVEAMLIADDDNADLSDGTPHINDICHAFYDNHGIFSEYCIGYTQKPILILESPIGPINKSVHEIKGVVSAGDDDPISFFYIDYLSNGQFRRNGITLTNNGQGNIIGVLGTLDTIIINEPIEELRITAVTGNGMNATANVDLIYDPLWKEGWPKKFTYSSEIIIEDINKDGNKEIVFSDRNSIIHVLNYSGQDIFLNPLVSRPYFQGGITPPIVGDLDKDGNVEIVSSSCDLSPRENTINISLLYGWDHEGNQLPNFPIKLIFNNEGNSLSLSWSCSYPSLIDINKDGNLEILIALSIDESYWPGPWYPQFKLYAFHYNGSLVDGWPFELNLPSYTGPGGSSASFSVSNAPVGYDLDNDGNVEVIVAINDYNWSNTGVIYSGGVYLLNHNGEVKQGNWPIRTKDFVWASPALSDFDKDGLTDIAFGTLGSDSRFFVVDHNGSNLTGWPKNREDLGDLWLDASPAIANLDGINSPEIIQTNGVWYNNKIFAWFVNGSNLNGWPKNFDLFYATGASTTVGDITKDSKPEVIVGDASGKVYAWESNGSLVDGWPRKVDSGVYLASPITDLNNDGKLELITMSAEGYLYIYDFNISYNPLTMQWPMFMHDSQHTGLYTLPYLCADLNHDNVRDILDVVLLINHAFRNGPEPKPKWIGDLNGDNVIDILDVVHMINHAFRNGPVPTCTSQPLITSSSGTASLGSATGATIKTIPVNLADTENVAGATFKLSYDPLKLYIKSIRTSSRTSNMELIINGNTFTLIKQDGSQTISAGSGTIAYIDVTSGKAGFDVSSLKITEAKAANPDANKISLKIGSSSTSVKSGTSLS